MTESLTNEQLAEIRKQGPVGYYCDHSDESHTVTSHHAWEWVDGQELVFQHVPDVVKAFTLPKGCPDPERTEQQCPRAVRAYAVDVPALVDEIARLRGVEADYERFKEHNGATLLQGFLEGLDRSARAEAEVERLRAELDRRDQADAETLVDQTLIRELTVKDGGINLDLIPPHEIALLFVHAAKGMLGDAPNYSETPVAFPREAVSMEVKAAGEYDSYVLTVQRKGKLTPHEARQAAEKRAERAEAEAVRLRTELAAPLHFTANGFGAIRDDETGNVTATIDTVRGPVRIDLTEDLAEALGLFLLDDPEHSDGSVQPAPSGGCTCDSTGGHPNPLNGER